YSSEKTNESMHEQGTYLRSHTHKDGYPRRKLAGRPQPSTVKDVRAHRFDVFAALLEPFSYDCAQRSIDTSDASLKRCHENTCAMKYIFQKMALFVSLLTILAPA